MLYIPPTPVPAPEIEICPLPAVVMVAYSAPMVQKRALLIGVRSIVELEPKYGDLPPLGLAHRDVRNFATSLINDHGYPQENVIMMIDDRRHPSHLWPTRRNILLQIKQLTHNVPEGCHICFYFSGHGLEEECCGRANMRPNGLDDEIMTADGRPILDHALHDKLITPLEKVKDTKLFALFDCCHSESLLDLQTGKGPNTYSRKWSIGRDQLLRALSVSILALLKLVKKHCPKDNPCVPMKQRSLLLGAEPASEVHDVGGLSVICLSACRDGQLAYEDRTRQVTFTKCFMDVMAENPKISWWELREKLKGLVQETRMRYQNENLVQDPRISTNSSFTDFNKSVESQL